MIWRTLVLLVALAAPALATSHDADAAPSMVVNVVNLASCECIAQENVSITFQSGQCVRSYNPTVKWDCYVKTEAPHNQPPAEPNGRCHQKPACPDVARSCKFKGFDITITRRGCQPNTECCSGGHRVYLDDTLQGGVAVADSIGPITCDPGALQCGKDVTNKIKVTCGGAVVFRVEATFNCNQCTVKTEAQQLPYNH